MKRDFARKAKRARHARPVRNLALKCAIGRVIALGLSGHGHLHCPITDWTTLCGGTISPCRVAHTGWSQARHPKLFRSPETPLGPLGQVCLSGLEPRDLLQHRQAYFSEGGAGVGVFGWSHTPADALFFTQRKHLPYDPFLHVHHQRHGAEVGRCGLARSRCSGGHARAPRTNSNRAIRSELMERCLDELQSNGNNYT